jgi:hypothetical protein
MNKKLTILTTTHYKASAHRLEHGYPGNHDRLYTHTNLIEYMITSLYNFLNEYDITHYISLDHDPADAGSCEYLENLYVLAEKYKNIKIIVTETGIRNSILNLVNSVETDYFLWFEHDWEFVKEVNLNTLIQLMDNNSDINYIRFNKRKNLTAVGDRILKEFNIDNINLCATNLWSNNPYIARTSFWKNTWIPLLVNNTGRQYVTIERELEIAYSNIISAIGFDRAVKTWGVFIYGKYGDTNVVNHLNGKTL